MDFELAMQNNGEISNWICPTHGVHQGCCISPHLYNCVGQVFADILSNNEHIDPVTAQGIRNLLAQFADDTNLFLHASEKCIRAVSDSIAHTSVNLGLVINAEKTIMYRIGSLKNTNAKYYTQAIYLWQEPPIYTLGIHVTSDFMVMESANLLPVLEKAQTTLQQWKKRNLTLTGHVLVVNTLVESLFVYRLSVIPHMQQSTITKVQALVMDFIWKGKKPKISSEVLMTSKEHGGMHLFNIVAKHCALLCQWIFVLRDDDLLKKAMHSALSDELGETIWRCNLTPKDVKKIIRHSFWKFVLKAWAYYNYQKPETHDEIVHQVLWLNSDIRRGGTPFISKDFHRKGIIKLKDITQNNMLMSYNELIQKYGKGLNWLEYKGLCKAIPNTWKDMLVQEQNVGNYIPKYDQLLKKPKASANIYSQLIAKPLATMNNYKKWCEIEDFRCSFQEYLCCFQAINKTTISVKL